MLVTENQLDEWVRGNSRVAQGLIVELVWRLVAASSPKPRERRFPLSDSIGQHGPDGLLEVDLPFPPFVPEGRSFWEVGTDLRPGRKATSDYNDLTNATPTEVKSDSVFVFVTPLSGRRSWEGSWKEDAQLAWVKEKRERREWKDVRVIDGTRLIDWLRQFPSVDLWLAQKTIGLPQDQIDTPELHWDLIRSIGGPPPLSQEVFLTNRDEASGKIQQVFDETSMQLKLETHYPNEVVDFIAAYLASLDAENRADAAGRCLFISGMEAWNAIVAHSEKHFLVADATLSLGSEVGTKLVQKARRAGHAVIFGGPKGGIPDPQSAPLRAPRRHQLRDALEKSGHTEERARTLVQKSGGNLSSLLRCLQNVSLFPEWAEGVASDELTVAAVLGSWTEKSDADRDVVQLVSEQAYGEWIGKLREIALHPGTPLAQRDGNWKFIARYEGWYALGSRLFDDDLARLSNVASSVLCEIDPQFELPPSERFASEVHGKILKHSHLLRSGLAECLALLGSHPGALTSCSLGQAANTAALSVRSILAEADWQRWASLNDLLPLLAEAAPSTFLAAVEQGLSCRPSPFREVFAQESDGPMGGTYMSGLLWALETLAWDANHLSRVVICLGELAALDPGGRWANRPLSSLTTILLPWLPQTCASIPQRGSAVATLLAEQPIIGWKLVLALLPKSHSTSSGSRRPAWRETIPEDWSKGVTNQEYFEQVALYSEMAITASKNSLEKLTKLMGRLQNLARPAHDQLLAHLGSDSVLALPESDRLPLWTALVDLVSRHKKASGADWAMDQDLVDTLSALATRLEPTDPSLRHRRLFGERDVDLYEEMGNYNQQGMELETRRREAIKEIEAKEGLHGVLTFAANVHSPSRVGSAYGVVAAREVDRLVLPDLIESDESAPTQFVGGFVWSRFRVGGWSWVDKIETSQWTPPQIAQFLSYLPFIAQTWERAEILLGNDEFIYWTKTSANPYDTDLSLDVAIHQLIKHGRPHAAIRCFGKLLHEKKPIDPGKAVEALMASLQSSEDAHSMDSYEIVDVIRALQDDPTANATDLYQVEWAYLPLLDDHNGAAPTFLSRRLGSEPDFFCEVIRMVFRSKNQEISNVSGETTERVATNAYRLLREWRIPPGFQSDGTYNGDVLNAWLERVTTDCSASGHLEIALTMLGHSLVHVPEDPTGLWIHRAAATALNAKTADDMRDGFRAELYNSRGVHWVDPSGKSEKELAEKYRRQANEVEVAGFHRLAITVRELAASYDREAERVSSRETFED